MQHLFVGGLQADLADLRGAGIGVAIDVLEVLFTDRADVAQRVHGARAERVPAGEARSDLDAGEFVLVDREATDLVVGQ